MTDAHDPPTGPASPGPDSPIEGDEGVEASSLAPPAHAAEGDPILSAGEPSVGDPETPDPGVDGLLFPPSSDREGDWSVRPPVLRAVPPYDELTDEPDSDAGVATSSPVALEPEASAPPSDGEVEVRDPEVIAAEARAAAIEEVGEPIAPPPPIGDPPPTPLVGADDDEPEGSIFGGRLTAPPPPPPGGGDDGASRSGLRDRLTGALAPGRRRPVPQPTVGDVLAGVDDAIARARTGGGDLDAELARLNAGEIPDLTVGVPTVTPPAPVIRPPRALDVGPLASLALDDDFDVEGFRRETDALAGRTAARITRITADPSTTTGGTN